MLTTKQLGRSIQLRELRLGDAAGLAEAYQRNRIHLAPWEPVRNEVFYSVPGQESEVKNMTDECAAGRCCAWVLLDGSKIIGRVTLSGIVKGAFRSAALGYWIDAEYQGRGLATSMVRLVAEYSLNILSLHRIQAETLLRNLGSQRVLGKAGFEEIGMAPKYLCIAGEWQDHKMFQKVLYDNQGQ